MSWIGGGVAAGLLAGFVLGWMLRARRDGPRNWVSAEARELRGHLQVMEYRVGEAERRAGKAEHRIAEAERLAAEAERRAAMSDAILASVAEAKLRHDPPASEATVHPEPAVPPAPSVQAATQKPLRHAARTEPEDEVPATDAAFEAIKAKSDALRQEQERREEDEERRRRQGG